MQQQDYEFAYKQRQLLLMGTPILMQQPEDEGKKAEKKGRKKEKKKETQADRQTEERKKASA